MFPFESAVLILKLVVVFRLIGFLIPGIEKLYFVPTAGVEESLNPLLIVIVLVVVSIKQVGDVGKFTKFEH